MNAPAFLDQGTHPRRRRDLFARHGFAGASLRQVTAAANVNLAAVNYHFGSKDNLIEEVFRRRLDELNARRLAALKSRWPRTTRVWTDVLGAFIRPALELSLDHGGGHAFMRVLARAYAEHDERLRSFLSDNYGHVLREFATAFARLLPQLDKEELYWRLDFITGALTHAMADFGLMKRRGQVSEETHRERAADHLIRFAAAGLARAVSPVDDVIACLYLFKYKDLPHTTSDTIMTIKPLRIRKAAVLGAGVMGAQIAAHLANADVETVLFDLAAKEGGKNGIALKAIQNLAKLSPSPLADKTRGRIDHAGELRREPRSAARAAIS